MEIILKADVPHLGKMLDIVQVKSGYARNYLFPRRLAVLASKKTKEEIEKNRAAMEALFRKELAGAEGVAAKMSETSVQFVRRVVEEERLYGSVSSADIAAALKKQGFAVERSQVELIEPIKQLGNYSVKVRVFASVEANVSVWVVKEE